MVKLLIDLLEFLRACAPLLTSTLILTLLCVLLSKSIKKHATVYYLVLAIPFLLVAVPFIGRLMGMEVSGFTGVPILGVIVRDYIHMGEFGHPLLIIIMYMGALSPRLPFVKNLMSIRKELSIIVGFPVLTHSLIRVSNGFPNSLKYFTNHSEYMETARVTNEVGAAISNFSLVLGIVMLALFLPLWITSFNSIHKRMGNVNWKKLQKWSYVLYATLFIHAMGIQVGGMLNPRGGGHGPRPQTEVVADNNNAREQRSESGRPSGESGRPSGESGRSSGESGRSSEGGRQQGQTATPQAQGGRTGGRVQAKTFTGFTVDQSTKRHINIATLVLIYGSYLFLRIRKAKA